MSMILHLHRMDFSQISFYSPILLTFALSSESEARFVRRQDRGYGLSTYTS